MHRLREKQNKKKYEEKQNNSVKKKLQQRSYPKKTHTYTHTLNAKSCQFDEVLLAQPTNFMKIYLSYLHYESLSCILYMHILYAKPKTENQNPRTKLFSM